MNVFQVHLCNNPTEGFLQPTPHTAMLFSVNPLGVHTSPAPPIDTYLKLHDGLCRHWRF